MIELAARGLLTIGAVMAVGSLLMLRFTGDGTAEQAITWISLIIGIAALLVAGVSLWLLRRHQRLDLTSEPQPQSPPSS